MDTILLLEKDLALHLNLIAATTNVIYYNPATDPYSTTLSQWNAQLQSTLTSVIGEANYDIGHMFGASGGANFLSRTTAVLAAVFLSCTLGLAYFGNLRASTGGGESILERAVPASSSASAAPASQIPGAASAAAPVAVQQSPAPEASGAAQIPAK